MVLEVRKGYFNDPQYYNDKTAIMNLPAIDKGVWQAVEAVEAVSAEECALHCTECLIPSLRDTIDEALEDGGLAQVNEFARELAQKKRSWSEAEFVRYKALLAASGQPTARFVFEGFLPVNRKQKKERLAELLQEKRTTIFYEAPHKLRTTLDDLANAFGADRSITLCRELTKLHEDIWKTTLGEAVEHYKANEPRGEYVLVMAGAPETADPEQELTLEQAAHRALELTGQGFGPTAAAKAAAQGTPYSKSEVYKQLLVLQQGQQAAE